MKHLGLLFFLFLAPASVQAGTTQDPIPVSEQRLIKDYFSGMAGTFGCSKLSHASFSNLNLAELEYLSPNETRYLWTKVVSVIVQALPEDRDLAFSAMGSYNASMIERHARQGEIIEIINAKASDNTPVTYIEYSTGSGASKEHGVLVYGRHTPKMAAMMKLVVHGFTPLEEEQRSKMKSLTGVIASK